MTANTESRSDRLECAARAATSPSPLDTRTIIESVKRTGRLLITEPAHRTCGAGAEIAAIAADEAFRFLRAPIRRVAAPNMQVPFSPVLEAELYPTTEKIAAAIVAMCSN